jgi:BlaR1 peptidase M56
MSDVDIALRVAGSQLESVGHVVTRRVLALNAWTGVLVVAAILLDRALARRVKASWRVALYAPVALRVLLPLDFRLPFADAARVGTFFAPLVRIGAAPAADVPTWQTPSWHAVAALVYFVVAAALAAQALLARVRLERALVGAATVPSGPLGVPCRVVRHDELGPMAVGLLSPRIVLPRRILAPGEEHALACVLRHEHAHLRRHDAWLSAAMQVLAIVAWPVAPLWIATIRVRQLVELACDEAAISGADATERRRYGHALLDMAEWRTRAVVPIGAGAMHFGSTLHARIEALASQRHWPAAAQAVALGLASLALLVACGSGSTAVPPTAPADETGYGYQFADDSSKAAPASTANVPPPGPDGRIPPEAIQALVRARFGAFKACYETGLQKNPKLAGTVSVKFTIAENGTTMEAADDASTLPDKDVVACVIGEMSKITYAAGSGIVTVVYPIQFSP